MKDISSSIRLAVNSSVDSAVESAVYSSVHLPVFLAVRSAVYSSVDSAVYSPVWSAVRSAVNHCIAKGAYKTFNRATVGHFAFKVDDSTFLSSIRRTNFNELAKVGLVKVKTVSDGAVIAMGQKPSVGGQSQRMIFKDHPEVDCIVHFHCPLKEKPRDFIPVRPQREIECGSHECGKNTSAGLKDFSGIKAVMLDHHGPNIVFNKAIDPSFVIDFIDNNFDLDEKTGGYNLVTKYVIG